LASRSSSSAAWVKAAESAALPRRSFDRVRHGSRTAPAGTRRDPILFALKRGRNRDEGERVRKTISDFRNPPTRSLAAATA
jgi:hypothetical protein